MPLLSRSSSSVDHQSAMEAVSQVIINFSIIQTVQRASAGKKSFFTTFSFYSKNYSSLRLGCFAPLRKKNQSTSS
jgi:hypothetical protein